MSYSHVLRKPAFVEHSYRVVAASRSTSSSFLHNRHDHGITFDHEGFVGVETSCGVAKMGDKHFSATDDLFVVLPEVRRTHSEIIQVR